MDTQMLTGWLCCMLPIGLAIGVAIGAVILRAGISLANKVVGKSAPQPSISSPEFQSGYEPAESDNPYAATSSSIAVDASLPGGIPQPEFPKACGIVVVAYVISFVIGTGLGLMTAVIFDHFSVLGLPRHPISLVRIAGIACVVIGVVLTTRN